MKGKSNADISRIGRPNARSVLAGLRSRGRMGRAEIARITGLSVPTVSRVVGELERASLIAAVDSARIGSAKRKTALLDIKASGGWVAAMEVGAGHIKASAMDLAGNLHESVEQVLENVYGAESVAPAILEVLSALIDQCEARRGKPLAIGISSAGIVDPELGIVRISFNLQLKDFPIARIVREHWDLPVVVNNNVAASTLAEAKFGHGREHASFAYVMVGVGIGAGLVFDGEVHKLPQRAEFGLMVVAPEGDPERFGGRGYLESLASGRGIAAAARRELESGANSLIAELCPAGPAFVTAKTVAEAASRGDDLARGIFARAANCLGIGIVNLAHSLGLTLFVIGGGVAKSGDVFWDPLRESVEKYEYWPGEIRLEPSLLNEDAAVLGAGTLALDEVFNPASARP